jgi:hypothetical protein
MSNTEKYISKFKEKEDLTMKETKKHIETVNEMVSKFIKIISKQAKGHDQSKLEEPEFSTFKIYTEKLKNSTYGSDEYKGFLKDMKPALDHHYKNNSHHPEHHDKGIDGMNLVDLLEMFCDWKAATMRHDDGCIKKSIEINAERFKISPQLKSIFKNSVDLFEEKNGN